MLTALLLVSGISAVLAVMLVFAERVISNYGDVEIDINNGEKKVVLKGGRSLLDGLSSQKIFIPSACGGRGTCAYCKIIVLEGGGTLLPTEEPLLSSEERGRSMRLSCQVKLRNSVKIEIPRELFAIREYRCTCEKIIDYTYDMKQFNLKLTGPDPINFRPGQYVQVLAPAYKGSPEEVYRAYSISSDPADRTRFELIVRRVEKGICTTYLFDFLKENDRLQVNGPYGEFYLRDTRAPIIFIAGGSGIAPIKCMLHDMVNRKVDRKAALFFGVRTTKDLFLVDDLKGLEKRLKNFVFVPVVSQPEPGSNWTGTTGRVTDVGGAYLARQPDAKEHECYLCGSPGLVESSIAVATKYGIGLDKIYYDKFT